MKANECSSVDVDMFESAKAYMMSQLTDDEWLEDAIKRQEEEYLLGLDIFMRSHGDSEHADSSVYTCAVCKMGYVYRIHIKNSHPNLVRLACENQKCLDVKFPIPDDYDLRKINVESLMTSLNCAVMEHKQQSPHCSPNDLKVSIEEINDEDYGMESSDCAVSFGRLKCFLSNCAKCDYTEVTPLNL